MKKKRNVEALLKPLFDIYEKKMKPASQRALKLFRSRAEERKVPDVIIEQLAEFYALTNGVPCLDSLDIHRCDDLSLFEWWEERELWLGQRDFYTLRWSLAKDRFCIGDAGNVSFSASDEHRTLTEALQHLLEPDES